MANSQNYIHCKWSRTCSTRKCGPCLEPDSNAHLIKRFDTCPNFEIKTYDSYGRKISFEDWNVSVNMYFETRLNNDLTDSLTDDVITLMSSKDICQVKIGDIIRVESCNQNQTEYMLVIDIDYNTSEIIVERNYDDSIINSTLLSHSRGECLIFYRIWEKQGYVRSSDANFTYPTIETENTIQLGAEGEVLPGGTCCNPSGNLNEDFSIIGYQFTQEDTSIAGEYFLEFELSNSDGLVRSFPTSLDGDYKIQILPDSNFK